MASVLEGEEAELSEDLELDSDVVEALELLSEELDSEELVLEALEEVSELEAEEDSEEEENSMEVAEEDSAEEADSVEVAEVDSEVELEDSEVDEALDDSLLLAPLAASLWSLWYCLTKSLHLEFTSVSFLLANPTRFLSISKTVYTFFMNTAPRIHCWPSLPVLRP